MAHRHETPFQTRRDLLSAPPGPKALSSAPASCASGTASSPRRQRRAPEAYAVVERMAMIRATVRELMQSPERRKAIRLLTMSRTARPALTDIMKELENLTRPASPKPFPLPKA
ncbi:MAG: hypothetical protein ACLSHC_12960 [Bilophila wadsworthia]